MNLSTKSLNVISLFAEDLARTSSFYEEVLGMPRVFEDDHMVLFKFENIMLSVRDTTEATGHISPATVASPETGSRSLLAVFVENVDELCAELVEHGVEILYGPVDRPWGMRAAGFKDPAGHLWQLSQDLDES